MLYTGKGDKGTTALWNSPKGTRVSKSDLVFDALGTLDELNCSIGYAKALCQKSKDSLTVDRRRCSYEDILENAQQTLFCIQAELGGSDKRVGQENIIYLEKIINEIETFLPPIKSFIVPGGGDTGAFLDICRTVARRAERQLVEINEEREHSVGVLSIAFINRLSSLLYALARFANYQEGYYERKPNY